MAGGAVFREASSAKYTKKNCTRDRHDLSVFT